MYNYKRNFLVFVAALCLSCAHTSDRSQDATTTTSMVIAPREAVEAHGKKWVISTQGKYTTKIAADVIRKGGNLIDAAIAASFAVSVERPQSTGIGGGGFLIYHEAKSGKDFVFDFRERAPRKATKNMYLNEKGEVIKDLSTEGALAVATPGLVRGLKALHFKFGTQEWASLVKPAAELARNGFPIYSTLSAALESEYEALAKFPSSKAIFLHEDGSPKKLGELLVQKDLANTLEQIAEHPDDLYTGKTAYKIIATIKKYNGLITRGDLAGYTVKRRKPLSVQWRGYRVVSMPPPSSGGIHVIQILKMLEKFPLGDQKYSFLSAPSLHVTASAMQMAFADRAKYLGDPDFVKVPTQKLLADAYLKQRTSEITEDHARKMSEVTAGNPYLKPESGNTTHFSMMDQEGNAVVSTQTINGWFGSALVAEGTGIVLNNEMDDFSVKFMTANLFGAVGGEANAVQALKTPLSSMSPTIVFKGKTPVLAIGAPGGTRIITGVAQSILHHLVYGKDLYSAVAAPRIHQQWSPDSLTVELPATRSEAREEISPQTIRELEKLGWVIKRQGGQSNVMAVSRHGQAFTGVADPRDIGTSAGE